VCGYLSLMSFSFRDYSLLLAIVLEEPGVSDQYCTCCGGPKSHYSCKSCALPICRGCVPGSTRVVCHLCQGAPTCPLRVTKPRLYTLPEDETMTCQSVFRHDDGGFLGRNVDGSPKETYFMGIIDWLQPFNWRKKAENALKVMVQGADISVVEPPKYAMRFYSFLVSLIDPVVACRELNLAE
jgi:hypothetical protein